MNHAHEFPVEKMCQVLGVSRSGYYRFKRYELKSEDERSAYLDDKIRREFTRSRESYGSPRLTIALKAQGVRTH